VPAGTYRGVTSARDNGEWIMDTMNIPIAEYEKLANHFDPEQYDPKEWVRIAKDAGMKYIVITAKHHDGFSLWDSKVTEWDVVDATPYKKDLLKPLAEACREAGIKLCFYYSIMDWAHPDAQGMWEPYYNSGRTNTRANPNFPDYVENFMKPQLRELMTEYAHVFDWPEDGTLKIEGIGTIKSAQLLTPSGNQPVEFTTNELQLKEKAVHAFASVIALELE
jgi:alpha-L-fucosidase